MLKVYFNTKLQNSITFFQKSSKNIRAAPHNSKCAALKASAVNCAVLP